MTTTKPFPSITTTTAPTVLPLTAAECRQVMRIYSSETGHDAELARLCEAARDTFESDTGIVTINTTFTRKQDGFETPIQLTHRPISSISSITYYDTANASQTLATSVYELDAQRQQIVLNVDQTWPATYSRWDAVTIVYIAGEGAAATSVTEQYRQAITLLMRYDFDGDDFHHVAYERLIQRFLRRSYP